MENFIEYDCDCGDCHELTRSFVIKDNVKLFAKYLSLKNLSKIRIFIDNTVQNHNMLKDLKTELLSYNITFIVTALNVLHAEVVKADSIEQTNEEYVLAFGNSQLIEIVKYYACSINVNYSIIVNTEFYDFTFSKFARLYDGITFSFYMVSSPEFIFYMSENLSLIDLKSCVEYLHYKKLALFENQLNETLEVDKICSKVTKNIKKVLNKNLQNINNQNILNIFIYLGQAMSFFGSTKGFFSSEMELANLLEVLQKKDFLSCYIVAGKVVNQLYLLTLNSNIKIHNLNLNNRILNIKKIIKLPLSKCIRLIKKQKNSTHLLKYIRIVDALKYSLMNILDEEMKSFKNVCINRENLTKGVYLASEFTNRYTFLNLIRDVGLLELLL